MQIEAILSGHLQLSNGQRTTAAESGTYRHVRTAVRHCQLPRPFRRSDELAIYYRSNDAQATVVAHAQHLPAPTVIGPITNVAIAPFLNPDRGIRGGNQSVSAKMPEAFQTTVNVPDVTLLAPPK